MEEKMTTNIINEYLYELVKESSEELLKIYIDKDCETRLRFPLDKDGYKRISEQEFRFMLTNVIQSKPTLLHSSLYFSVETPTDELYVFSGKPENKRRASSDLSFYNGSKKVMNVEFKANPASQFSISKDIQKLSNEECNGAWIHLMKSENKSSVKNLFEKFEKAFEDSPTSKMPISFHILILESQTLLSRKGKEGKTDYSKNIFNIDYELWKELEKGQYQFKDWQIDVFDV